MSARPRYVGGMPKPATCLHGHPYTPDNTKVVINCTGRPQRRCRTCERAAGRASYRRHAEKRRAQGRVYDARRRAAKRQQRSCTDTPNGKRLDSHE